MKVLLIRHGIAEEQDDFARTGQPDELRPLTDEGKAEMRNVARGLERIVKQIDVIAASPLTRAQQTADIVANEFPDAEREIISAMAPDARFEAFLEWLSRVREKKVVLAAGHNPHISGLAAWLTGAPPTAIEMKKASALLIEFDDDVRAGSGILQWYLTPSQLAMLGGK